MRVVLDTDAIVAAMRSPQGGSAAVLRAARQGRLTLIGTVALALEYESVCHRLDHMRAAGFSAADLSDYLDAVIALLEPVDIWFLWRPQLRDAGDELVLEAAVNGRCEAIVGFNGRDFRPAADRFGIAVMRPGELLERLR